MGMPLYEYICQTCEHRFEVILRGSASPLCPACHAPSVEKQFSAFAVGGPADRASSAGPGACDTCGDQRGPGACSMN
jgi:putative FmdB family regulatory protein